MSKIYKIDSCRDCCYVHIRHDIQWSCMHDKYKDISAPRVPSLRLSRMLNPEDFVKDLKIIQEYHDSFIYKKIPDWCPLEDYKDD